MTNASDLRQDLNAPAKTNDQSVVKELIARGPTISKLDHGGINECLLKSDADLDVPVKNDNLTVVKALIENGPSVGLDINSAFDSKSDLNAPIKGEDAESNNKYSFLNMLKSNLAAKPNPKP